MNRKLHNSIAAVIASCAVLALGLVAAQPPVHGPVLTGPLTANVAEASILADAMKNVSVSTTVATADTDNALPRNARKSSRHRRQTLVMPYFSFAPRG